MKAIKSVLANRKMFRGGGLVPSRNEMVDLNAPSGILSSSMPLIDAVESDALSAEGGTALMSRGGYAHGGLHAPNPIRNTNPPIVVPNVDAWERPEATPIAPMPSLEVQSLTPDLNTAVPTFGSSDMPISFDFKLEDVRTILGQQQDVGQVDALVERIFPSDLQPGRLAKEFTEARIARSESPEAIAAGPSADIRLGEGNLGEPESGRMSRVTENVLRNTAGIREGVSKIFGPVIDHTKAWADYQFSGDTRDFTREQVYWINEMVQRRPDLQADIEAFATQSARGGTRDLDQFKHDIAAGISKKYEDTGQYTRFEGADDVRYRAENVEAGANPEVIAETLRREAANAASYDASLSERDPQGMFGPRGETPFAELLSGPEAPEFQNYMNSRGLEITEDSIYEMYKKGRDAGISVERIENSLSPEYLSRFENQYMIDTGGEEETVTETEAGTETETGEEVINIGDVEVTPDDRVDQESLVEGLTKHGELVAKREMDLGEDGTLENEARTQQHDTLVAGVREAANTGTAEETKDKLQLYIDEFKDAMPDYEGKSEWEQGLDIVKMGMAIAAGQDPNAVTNIANGVLATIDNFTSDDKERREYKREVGFAAAKYGLDAVRNDLVQEREDERALEWFYDKTKATEDMPYGPLVPISMADILSGEANLENLEHPDIVERKITVLGEIREAEIKSTAEAVKDRTITPTEGEKIEERFNNATELFETSTSGIKAFNGIIEKLVTNPDDYLGGKAEVKSLWGKAMVFAGVDPGKSWLNRKSLEADMKIGFQKLIIGALKGVQSANSISNRDVEFLADAYIDAGFLTPDGKGGFTFSTNLATQRPEILVQRLQSGIEIFRDGQQKALNAYDMNIEILSRANAKGRYGPETYRGQIETLMPYAEVARMERAKDLGTVEYATAVGERPFYYEFDPDAGYKRLKGKEGSPFAGVFFSPTDENWAKFEGN